MKNGFSLIELMVVIAIVALLAAVAVPLYSNYMVKAGFSKSQALIPLLNSRMSAFINEGTSGPINSSFDSSPFHYASLIGMPANWAGVPATASDYYGPPYLSYLQTIIRPSQYNSQCMEAGYIMVYSNFNNTGTMSSGLNGDTMLAQVYFIDNGSTVSQSCVFMDVIGNFGANHPDILPNCTYGSFATQLVDLATKAGC